MKNNTRKHGFTLVELLIVIAVIGILLGMLFALMPGITSGQQEVQTRMFLLKVDVAIRSFKNDFGQYPRCSDPDGNCNDSSNVCDPTAVNGTNYHYNTLKKSLTDSGTVDRFDSSTWCGDYLNGEYSENEDVDPFDTDAFVDRNAEDDGDLTTANSSSSGTSAQLIYIFKSKQHRKRADMHTADARTENASDGMNMTTDAYEGYTKEFELWSPGPDGQYKTQRSSTYNDDNITSTQFSSEPLEEL